MKKQLDKAFLISKVETCKNDWIRLSIIRNVLISSIGAILLMFDLAGLLVKTPIAKGVTLTIYIYSIIALLCVTLEISYRMNKYYKYKTVLDKYGLQEGITDEDLIKIQSELNGLSEYVIFLIWILNHLLYSVPLVGIIGLIYYVAIRF